LPKNNIVFEALGNADELNSSLGLAREFCLELHSNNKNLESFGQDVEDKLVQIQSTLLDIGSFVATPKTKATEKQLERLSTFNTMRTTDLEKWIDSYENELPVLRNFILPSGGKLASTLHLSRSICRRMERSLQPLLKSNDLDAEVVVYVNRLSDFLFVCARYASMKEGKPETVYMKQS
jgi:cob(I)alamin adenosyltransferase